MVKLEVGDVVVYAPLGVGRVALRETRLVHGVEREVIVLDLANDLSVTLLVENAHELLRPVLGEAGLRRVQETLQESGVWSAEVWSTRLKDAEAKLRRGDPLELAEILRDGAWRERTFTAKGTPTQLSTSEKGLCKKARELLSGEIGFARGLDPTVAEAWIDEQLALGGGA
jgi:CarD family transcriptional regulator